MCLIEKKIILKVIKANGFMIRVKMKILKKKILNFIYILHFLSTSFPHFYQKTEFFFTEIFKNTLLIEIWIL